MSANSKSCKRFILSYAFRVANAHFARDVLQYNTRDLYIYLHKGVKKICFAFRKTAPTVADLHVGKTLKGVQGVIYFVRNIILLFWGPQLV